MIQRQGSEIFSKIDSKKYDFSCCFLCGDDITANNNSVEHVIPKWLLRKYNSFKEQITLLNNTTNIYNKLVIPCCTNCNNNFLSRIEKIVIKGQEAGIDQFKKIEKELLFYWLGKIFYGLIYRELSLSKEISNPLLGNITTPEFLDDFKAHYMFLQGVRGKHSFSDFFPASIFIFKTQISTVSGLSWDFMDCLNSMAIAIRMGEIGIVAILQDGGLAETVMQEELKDFYNIALHPIQFREVATRIFYRSTLLNRVPKYISTKNDGKITSQQIPLAGLSTKPVYDQYNLANYVAMLSHYTNIPIEILNPRDDQIISWIKNKDGDLNYMDINKRS